MSEGNHWSHIKDRDIIGEIMEAKKRIEEMPVWSFTDKSADVEVVEIEGEKFLKLPQLSRKREDGGREVHPAFIKDGIEIPYILRALEPLPYIPLVQHSTDCTSEWSWITSQEDTARVDMLSRGPCGMKRGYFGGNPYFVGVTTQPGCMSDIRDCARCPANPNREIQRENKPKSGNQTGGKYGYR